MKDRIRQLMLDKAMTQKTFASELCIAEATLSGIFNGRTRPTHLTVNAIHERFPEVNISWLMFGEGEMYASQVQTSETRVEPSSVTENTDTPADLLSSIHATTVLAEHINGMPESNTMPEHHYAQASMPNTVQAMQMQAPQIKYIEKYIDKPRRKITEIRIFFDDGTYETFTP